MKNKEQQIADILELDGGMDINQAHVVARETIDKVIDSEEQQHGNIKTYLVDALHIAADTLKSSNIRAIDLDTKELTFDEIMEEGYSDEFGHNIRECKFCKNKELERIKVKSNLVSWLGKSGRENGYVLCPKCKKVLETTLISMT